MAACHFKHACSAVFMVASGEMAVSYLMGMAVFSSKHGVYTKHTVQNVLYVYFFVYICTLFVL